MRSIYFIPTNKDIRKQIESYKKEVLLAQDTYNITIPLVVIETVDDDVALQNAKTVHALQEYHPDLELYHLSLSTQHKYFDELLKVIPVDFHKLFLHSFKNYGNVMNKIFLFTASMGGDAFHRRDADTCLLSDEFDDVADKYPIEHELKYLGKQVPAEMSTGKNDQLIYVVGGNYFGEWNLDLKDFAQVSHDYMYSLYELIGFAPDAARKICDKSYQLDRELSQKDELQLIRSFESECYPDCGNMALYKIHEYFPAIPGEMTISGDYFPMDTAIAFGATFLHHTREVFHEYHTERFVATSKLNYWKGMMKFADYFNIYSNLYTAEESTTDFSLYKNNHKLLKQKQEFMIDTIMHYTYNQRVARKKRLENIITTILIGFDKSYTEIGHTLLESLDEILEESNRDYFRHTQLITYWSALINRAKEIDLVSLLRTDVFCDLTSATVKG